MKEKEIGQLFKEKLSGFQQAPPDGVWAKIEKDTSLIKFNRKHFIKKASYYASAVAAVAIVASAILFSGNQDTPEMPSSTPPADKTIPLSIQSDTAREIKETIPTNNTIALPKVEKKESPKTNTPPPYEHFPILPDNHPYDLQNLTQTPAQSHTPVKAKTAPENNQPKSLSGNQEDEPGTDTPGEHPSAEKIAHSRDTSVCKNSKLVLFVNNASSVYWHVGYISNTLEIYPSEAGVYRADIVDHLGNRTTIAIRVDVFDCGFYIPKAFTPDGNGLNDEFIVFSPVEVNDFEMSIFDISSGRLIFKTQDIMHGWDGTEGGRELPQGAYVYMITYKDKLNVPKVEKGQVILVR